MLGKLYPSVSRCSERRPAVVLLPCESLQSDSAQRSSAVSGDLHHDAATAGRSALLLVLSRSCAALLCVLVVADSGSLERPADTCCPCQALVVPVAHGVRSRASGFTSRSQSLQPGPRQTGF